VLLNEDNFMRRRRGQTLLSRQCTKKVKFFLAKPVQEIEGKKKKLGNNFFSPPHFRLLLKNSLNLFESMRTINHLSIHQHPTRNSSYFHPPCHALKKHVDYHNFLPTSHIQFLLTAAAAVVEIVKGCIQTFSQNL
jgi:hypothetical protein